MTKHKRKPKKSSLGTEIRNAMQENKTYTPTTEHEHKITTKPKKHNKTQEELETCLAGHLAW